MPGRILIADDVATNRIVLKSKLAAAHYEVLQARRRSEAPALALAERPDVVLIDLGTPASEALALMQAIRQNPATTDCGIIALGAGQDSAARRAALAAGADDIMTRPLDEAALLARIRAILRSRNAVSDLEVKEDTRMALGLAEPVAAFESPGAVALVAARADIALSWKLALEPHLRDRIELINPDRLLEAQAQGIKPDVFVIATDLRQRRQGLGLIAELRSRSADRHAGIVAVVPEGDTESVVTALDLGANDAVEEPIDPLELVHRVRRELRRKSRSDRLRRQVSDGLRLAVTDALTGLHNRRYALTQLARTGERAEATGRAFAVMAIDLDRFKRINDDYGHAAGDAVLVEFARRISGSLRSVDHFARIGGEEFLIVMPDTGAEAARTAGERFRRLVTDAPFLLPDRSGAIPVTISIGIAIGPRAGLGPTDLMAAADRALYDAKEAGRNQVNLGTAA